MYLKLIIILLFLITLVYLYKYKETFNDEGYEFMPLGYIRYGLRGEKLNTRPIMDCYWDQYNCYTSTARPKFTAYDRTPQV